MSCNIMTDFQNIYSKNKTPTLSHCKVGVLNSEKELLIEDYLEPRFPGDRINHLKKRQ